MYDVAIIGLGPAGATLARLLDKSLSVVAFDKKSEGAEGFKKPCGGLLAPDAQKSLAKFNLTLPLEVMVNPQIFAVRTLDVNSKLTRHYQRFYMNLDRHKFDIWLKSLVPEHVKIYNSSQCCKVQPLAQGGYEISWKEQGELQRVCAARLWGQMVRLLYYAVQFIRIKSCVPIYPYSSGLRLSTPLLFTPVFLIKVSRTAIAGGYLRIVILFLVVLLLTKTQKKNLKS